MAELRFTNTQDEKVVLPIDTDKQLNDAFERWFQECPVFQRKRSGDDVKPRQPV